MENQNSQDKKRGSIGKWAVIVGIVIVLNLFFNYAISLAYPEPSYEAFIPTSQVVAPITDQADCIAVGGQWSVANPMYAAPDKTQAVGSCDPNYTKEQQYQNAMTAYDRNVFIILVVLGVASIMLAAVLANSVLALAFSWGGVLSLVIASIRYWSDASGFVKLLVLAIGLAGLIWIAVRRMEPKS